MVVFSSPKYLISLSSPPFAMAVVSHDTDVMSCTMSREQRQAFESAGRQLWCRHCVHPPPAGGVLRPIPRVGPYHARGGDDGELVCSAACALAYTLEHPTYRSQMQRAAIMQEAFHDTGCTHVVPAPPQCMLAVFNGPWDIAEFRQQSGFRRLVRRREAPFASPIAIAEIYRMESAPVEPTPAPAPVVERDDDHSMSQLNEWGLTGLKRPTVQPDDLLEPAPPAEPGVYQQFLDHLEDDWRAEPTEPSELLVPEPRRPVRLRPPPPPSAGLSRFTRRE